MAYVQWHETATLSTFLFYIVSYGMVLVTRVFGDPAAGEL